MLGRRLAGDLAPVEEDARGVGIELDAEPSLAEVGRLADVLHAVERVPVDHHGAGIRRQAEGVGERAADEVLCPRAVPGRIGHRIADPAVHRAEPVVVDHERPLVAGPVGVGEDVLVDVSRIVHDVVEPEVANLGEQAPAMDEGEELPFVAGDESLVGPLVPRGATKLHAVLLGEPLDLPVAEHREARHRDQHRRDPEVLVPGSELLDRRPLVGVVHEVDVALEDLRVELERVPDQQPVVGVLLVAEHVHEGAVVDAVHPQGPDEVALHEPERLRQQERLRHLGGNAVHHLAPELLGHRGVEGGPGHGRLGPGRDRPALPRLGVPEALDVLLGERHRGIEPDDGEPAGHREDRLDDGLADLRVEVVELRRVVPGHARAVVAVVDVADVARPAILAPEDHGGVGRIPVVVLDLDPDARVLGEVRPAERVGGVGAVRAGEEPVRVLDDPARVDSHVVGDHVGRHADAPGPGAVAQGRPRSLAAEVFGDRVVAQGVRGGHRVGVAAELLDPLAGATALPEPDEPQPREAPADKPVELLVGDLVEAPDVAAIPAAELVQPDVRALGHQHDPGHPVLVLGEPLGLGVEARVRRRGPAASAAGTGMVAHPHGTLLFGDDVEARDQPVEQGAEAVAEVGGEEGTPAGPDPAQLAAERARLRDRRRTEHGDQVLPVRPEGGPAGEEAAQLPDDRGVGRRGREVAVVEQLAARPERRVRVLQPAGDELLEGHLAVRGPGSLPGEVGLRRHRPPRDRERRKARDEAEQGVVNGLRPQHLVEVVEGIVDRLGILVLTEDRNDRVEDLVDDPHRVERTRRDVGVGEPLGPAGRGHRRRQVPHGAQVGQDDIAGQREQGVVDGIAGPRVAPNVELALPADHAPSSLVGCRPGRPARLDAAGRRGCPVRVRGGVLERRPAAAASGAAGRAPGSRRGADHHRDRRSSVSLVRARS